LIGQRARCELRGDDQLVVHVVEQARPNETKDGDARTDQNERDQHESRSQPSA
jgi:hypothetical protein